jgi:hypothetical protein
VLNGRDQAEQDGEPGLRKLNDGKLTRAEILLMAQGLIGGNENPETSRFRGGGEFAVAKGQPSS